MATINSWSGLLAPPSGTIAGSALLRGSRQRAAMFFVGSVFVGIALTVLVLVDRPSTLTMFAGGVLFALLLVEAVSSLRRGVWFDSNGIVWRRWRTASRVAWSDVHGIRLVEVSRGSAETQRFRYYMELHSRGERANQVTALPGYYSSLADARRQGVQRLQSRSPQTIDVWDNLRERNRVGYRKRKR